MPQMRCRMQYRSTLSWYEWYEQLPLTLRRELGLGLEPPNRDWEWMLRLLNVDIYGTRNEIKIY